MASRSSTKAIRSEIVIRTTAGEALARIPESVREEVRYLWTRLQVHGGDLPRSIGVTSRNSGEGVSFTSQALAAVLARAGETCLVEANWWGTALPLQDHGRGLAGLLTSKSEMAEVLVATGHPGLTILPAGDLIESDQAVMANTESMRMIIQQLHDKFSYVVLDLPAITTSAVTLSFAAAAEAALLVIRQRSTRIEHVESAIRDLRHTELLGVILNDNQTSMPAFLRRRLVHA